MDSVKEKLCKIIIKCTEIAIVIQVYEMHEYTLNYTFLNHKLMVFRAFLTRLLTNIPYMTYVPWIQSCNLG